MPAEQLLDMPLLAQWAQALRPWGFPDLQCSGWLRQRDKIFSRGEKRTALGIGSLLLLLLLLLWQHLVLVRGLGVWGTWPRVHQGRLLGRQSCVHRGWPWETS